MRYIVSFFFLFLCILTHAQHSAPFRFYEVQMSSPESLLFPKTGAHTALYVIQIRAGSELAEELQENSNYMGNHTHIVYESPAKLAEWSKKGHIQAWARYDSRWKVHPDLWGSSLEEVPYLEVVFHQSFSVRKIKEKLGKEGIPVVKQRDDSYFMVVAHRDGVVEKLQAMDEVLFIHTGGRLSEPEDLRSKALHRSDLLESEGDGDLGFDGEGVSVLVRDDGMIGPHEDFRGRLFNDPTLPFDTTETHGDGVAGIIGAAGNVEKEGRGMAPGAFIYGTQYESSFLDQTLDLHIDDHVLYTNSSYSNGCNDGYTPNAAEVDRQIYEYPTLLHIFSAGNSNGRDCEYGAGGQWGNITGGHKQAKNSIATANVDPVGEIRNSSSRGPATDGRLKPDIAANGHNNYSTMPNNSYRPFGGTSGAAPCVAGVAAQLNEAYRSIYGEEPPSALLKAAMLNAANDAGTEGPDFVYGFGLLDAYGAYVILEQNRFEEGMVVSEDDTLTYTLSVPEGITDLKVMLYWADPPAQPMAEKALVNDLDVEIIDQDGQTYLPLRLDPTPNRTTLDDPAVPGKDRLNNVEQIVISEPDGTYTIKVAAHSLLGAQRFYLVYDMEIVEEEEEQDFRWISPTPYTTQVNISDVKNVFVEWENNVSRAFIKTLSYSVDAGQTWHQKRVVGSRSSTTLFLDDASNGDSVLLAFEEGEFTDTLWEPFYVAEVHTQDEIQLDQICPQDFTIAWDKKENATSYIVYLLGTRYMDSVFTTTDTFATVPRNRLQENLLVAINTSYGEKIQTGRSEAAFFGKGLRDCPQDYEVGILMVEQVRQSQSYFCDTGMFTYHIELENNGLLAVDSIEVCVQIDDRAIQCQSFEFLLSAGQRQKTEPDSILFVGQAEKVKIWVNTEGDIVNANDTIEEDLAIQVFSSDAPISDSLFVDFTRIPDDLVIINPMNDQVRWMPATFSDAYNEDSQCLTIFDFLGSDTFSGDRFFLPPFTVPDSMQTLLHFNHAYYGTMEMISGLLVEIEELCQEEGKKDTLYYAFGAELETIPEEDFTIVPRLPTHWATHIMGLDGYQGKDVIVTVSHIRESGGALLVDNFKLIPDSSYLISANVTALRDSFCEEDTAMFILEAESPDRVEETKWIFPNQSEVLNTDSLVFSVRNEIGQFIGMARNKYMVTYDTSEIRYIGSFPFFFINQNRLGQDEVELRAVSTNTDSLVWTAPNGFYAEGTSVVYERQDDELEVEITATGYNECGMFSGTEIVEFTSSVGMAKTNGVEIYPNPSRESQLTIQVDDDRFTVDQVSIKTITGRQLWTGHLLPQGAGRYILSWPHEIGAGSYILVALNREGVPQFQHKIIRIR